MAPASVGEFDLTNKFLSQAPLMKERGYRPRTASDALLIIDEQMVFRCDVVGSGDLSILVLDLL